MKRLTGLIKRNKLYTVLTVFIILINLLVLVERFVPEKPAQEEKVSAQAETVPAEDAAKKTAQEPEKKSILQEDAEVRQNRIAALAKDKPKLYLFIAVFNLLIFFMLFAGLVIDGYLVSRFLRKDPVRIHFNEQDAPRWGIPDVIRVVIIFLAFGYMFVIAQAFFLKVFPILNNENFRMVFSTAMMNIVGISVIVYFVVKKHGQKIKDIGITSKRMAASISYAITGYLALLPVLVVVMIVTYFITEFFKYKPPVQPIVEVFMEEKATGVLWLSTLFAAIFGPIAEEIFFRGFMYPAIKKTLGIFWGVVITSAVFSFLHAHWVGFVPIMTLGILLAYLYEKTGSLVPSIAVHIIHNVGMVMLVFIMRNIS